MQLRYLMMAGVALLLSVSVALGQSSEPTVAIFDFEIPTSVTRKVTVRTDDGTESREIERSRKTSLLTNKLITALTQSDEVAVVEREKMARIMEEHSLRESDLTNPKKAIEAGRLLGADYMLFGSISMLEGNVEMKELPYNAGTQKIKSMVVGADARLVNTETGQIDAAASLQAERSDKEMNPGDESHSISQKFQHQVYDALVEKIAAHMTSAINPIKVAKLSGDTAYLSRGKLKAGSTYKVVKLGEVIKHPDSGEVIGQTETPVAHIEVTAGLNQMSKATVTEWLSDEQSMPSGSICRPVSSPESEQQ